MTLAKTYVIPHGDEILSLPNEESKKMNDAIREGTKDDTADTVLIISPHSLRIPSGLPVINTQHVSGSYKIGKNSIKGEYETDRTLNSMLIKASRRFVETNFITTEGPLSTFPLDFGTLIPLTFFCVEKISTLGQWRTNEKSKLIELGRKMYDVISKADFNVSVIFSADQAHTHSESGPYGYDERARKYDKMVIRAIETNRFQQLIDLDDDFIGGAKPDSYWNMLMFHGFCERGNLRPKFHYYYIQQYFGMLFATAET